MGSRTSPNTGAVQVIEDELTVIGRLYELHTNSCPHPGLPPLDLNLLPTPSRPWSWISWATGVRVDRPLTGFEVTAPHLTGRGTTSRQTAVTLDEFEITDDVTGVPLVELAGMPLSAVRVASGAGESIVTNSGLKIDLRTRFAGNNWRASGQTTQSGDGSASASGERQLRLGAVGLELGGAVQRDKLWAWAALSELAHRKQAASGQRVSGGLQHLSGKLEGRGTRSDLAVSWHTGTISEAGRGASSARAPEATWDARGETDLWQIRGMQVFGSSTYLVGAVGRLSRQLAEQPRGALPAGLVIDTAGVVHGTAADSTRRQELEEQRLSGHLFFATPPGSLELQIGARRRTSRRADLESSHARQIEDGRNLGLPRGLASLTLGPASQDHTSLEQSGLWLQGSLEGNRLTLSFGLGVDFQRASSQVSALASPRQVHRAAVAGRTRFVPRLGLAWALDENHQTVLRANYGRFAERLGPLLARRWTGTPFVERWWFEDLDGDLVRDRGEAAHLWFESQPDRFAANLEPELTDDIEFGIERQLDRGIQLVLAASHRRTRRVLERRTWVREPSTGAPRQATVDDWVEAGVLTGSLPDGTAYHVPFFDLRPGIEPQPWGVWLNGDRGLTASSASLTLRWRLPHRIHLHGHLDWSERRWRLGPEFERFDDPTDAVGGADNDGQLALENGASGLFAHTWSFYLGSVLELPKSWRLGLVLRGREGDPEPYFRRVARPGAGPTPVALTASVDALHHDHLAILDLRLTKVLARSRAELALSLDVFNALGAEPVLRRVTDLGFDRGGAVEDALAPRGLRLGVRLAWR